MHVELAQVRNLPRSTALVKSTKWYIPNSRVEREMSRAIPAPTRIIHHTRLSPNSFAAFGTVIENPSPNMQSTADLDGPSGWSSTTFKDPAESEGRDWVTQPGGQAPSSDLPHAFLSNESASRSPSSTVATSTSPPPWNHHPSTPKAVLANQNTALKYLSVSPLTNLYSQSPSQTASRTSMNLFACFPRVLTHDGDGDSQLFKVRILERHPFTTQTFIPMGLAAGDPSTRYLVIVAPTLDPNEAFPNLGPPDLDHVCAFLAHGGQAVTYAPGTWHAPMVVVGRKRVDFVVVQFCNGVPAEDCEECELEGEGFDVAVNLVNI